MDYREIAERVAPKIEEYGALVTLRRSGRPAEDYDPAEGTYSTAPAGSDITWTSYALELEITTSYALKVGQQNISSRDKLLMLPADANPIEQDEISFDGSNYWQILRITEQAPGRVPLYYICQVRP